MCPYIQNMIQPGDRYKLIYQIKLSGLQIYQTILFCHLFKLYLYYTTSFKNKNVSHLNYYLKLHLENKNVSCLK
jgi:hypothetical protein